MKVEKIEALVVSTSHITEQDAQLLGERSGPCDPPDEHPSYYIIPAADEYGFWLWAGDVTDEGECEIRCRTAEDEGYSMEFIAVLRLAQRERCTHLRLDSDGPVYPNLATCDW